MKTLQVIFSFLFLTFSFTGSFAETLPFPEDTIAYNDRFNNRQWVQFDADGNIHVTYTGQYGTAGHTRDIYYANNINGNFETVKVTDTGGANKQISKHLKSR